MRIGRPKAEAKFLTGNDFSWFFEERDQDLVNLALELYSRPIPGHFLPLLVNPEGPKMDITARGEGLSAPKSSLHPVLAWRSLPVTWTFTPIPV